MSVFTLHSTVRCVFYIFKVKIQHNTEEEQLKNVVLVDLYEGCLNLETLHVLLL